LIPGLPKLNPGLELANAVGVQIAPGKQEVADLFTENWSRVTSHPFKKSAESVISVGDPLQSRVYWFAFEREHSEDTLMNAPQRFALNKTLEAFQPQCKFA
jgi:hypothetical protein